MRQDAHWLGVIIYLAGTSFHVWQAYAGCQEQIISITTLIPTVTPIFFCVSGLLKGRVGRGSLYEGKTRRDKKEKKMGTDGDGVGASCCAPWEATNEDFSASSSQTIVHVLLLGGQWPMGFIFR